MIFVCGSGVVGFLFLWLLWCVIDWCFWYWFRGSQTLVTVGSGVLLFYVLVGYLSWLTCYGV